MLTLLHGLRWVILIAAAMPLIYYFLAIVAALRFFRGHASPPRDFSPPVSILKPVHGLDREAHENFSSFCNLDYPEYEILFNVSDERDPAIPVIEKIIRDFPRVSIRLLIGAKQIGTSDKVNKLSRMASEARHDVLVISDADIRVSRDYLRAVVAPFRDAKVGAVTCLYRGIPSRSYGSVLEAIGNSADFAAGVLVAWLFNSVDFALGATMATTKARLAEIGGFEGIAGHFTDDHELGHRIAAKGHRVEIASIPVDTVYPITSVKEYFRHQLRWCIAIRNATPSGHLGLIFAHGLAWALLVAAIAPWHALALAYAAAYVVLCGLMAWTVGVWGMRDPLLRKRFWLVPAQDACAFFILIFSFFTRSVHWRGAQYAIRGKELIPIEPPARSS
ncbi:MAG: bacteriohopanetetrol glucosamine biosynthesis glycosyltransferase HpnI [Candidatus Acidiferrales bacterium]